MAIFASVFCSLKVNVNGEWESFPNGDGIV